MSANQIATVPASAGSYSWVVDKYAVGSEVIQIVGNAGITGTSKAFNVTTSSNQASITSINPPSSGSVGSTITITGTNFDSKYNQISFTNCGYYTTRGDQYKVPSADGKTITTTVPHIMDGA